MFNVLFAVEYPRIHAHFKWWGICVSAVVCSQSIVLFAGNWCCVV